MWVCNYHSQTPNVPTLNTILKCVLVFYQRLTCLAFAASSHFRCGLLHVSLQRYKAWAGIRKMFDRSEYRWKKKLQNHVSAAICWCKSDLGYSIKLSDHSTLTCVWLHGYFNMAMGNPAVLHSLMLALP